MKVAVIGAGSWGTALSQTLTVNGHDVNLMPRRPEVADSINHEHRNPRYLTDVVLSDRVTASLSYREALAGARACVIVTPSNTLRNVGRAIADIASEDLPIVICSKGVEEKTGLLPIEVLAEEVGNPDRIAVLSGPNHAEEVIKGIYSATVIASSSNDTAVFFRDLFATDSFRAYTSDDPVGVELCAAFKNVIAIAVGVSYGMGLGDNTAAMLITRGLAEMSRMVVACGGQALTCMGLAGTGDMVVTCMSEHSRNRRFGERYIAKGKSVDDFYAETHMVVEGALACKTLEALSVKYGVELPITDIVRSIVWDGVDVKIAAMQLSDRPLTTEFYGL